MRRPAAALACLLVALAATAWGRNSGASTATGAQERPGLGVKGSEPEAAHDLGFPGFATKNTTRIGGADAIANAAGAAHHAPNGTRGGRRLRGSPAHHPDGRESLHNFSGVG